ncbi:MAG: hypothetical protein H8D49_01370 [Dehalococcoidia bacterium]|nr:hypothetical protein [Dehalococcoidia bacterium]
MTTLLAAVVLVTPGCGQPPPEAASETAETTLGPPSTTPTEESDDGVVVVDLSLSDAPAVNQTVELTLVIDVLASVLKPVTKVWMEFERYDPALHYPIGRSRTRERVLQTLAEKFDPTDPYYVRLKELAAEQPETLVPQEAVLVSGNWSWEGPPLKGGDRVRLASIVRFAEEGEWLINAWWQSEGDVPRVRKSLKLTLTGDSGTFGWPTDYSPTMEEFVPDEERPLSVKLSIAKAPRLGEPTRLTWSIVSTRDIAEAEARVSFDLMEEGGGRRTEMPIEEILVDGDLSWEGALEKDTVVQLSAVVTFLEAGDWQITVSGTSPEHSAGCGDALFLNVTNHGGTFGWVQPHERDQEEPEELVPADWGKQDD